MKPNLVPYEVIEKAVDGDAASLIAIQQHFKPFIGYLSNGDTDLKEVLNSKLLEAIFKFKIDYQPPSK